MNGENGGLVTRISRIIQASSSVSVSSIEFFLQTDKHHVVQPAAYPSFCIQDPFSCSFTYHHVSMSTCVCAFVFTRWMYTSVLCICSLRSQLLQFAHCLAVDPTHKTLRWRLHIDAAVFSYCLKPKNHSQPQIHHS